MFEESVFDSMGEHTKRSGLLKMTWETFLKAGFIALERQEREGWRP